MLKENKKGEIAFRARQAEKSAGSQNIALIEERRRAKEKPDEEK